MIHHKYNDVIINAPIVCLTVRILNSDWLAGGLLSLGRISIVGNLLQKLLVDVDLVVS